jgi:hypothetical protein
MFGGVVDVVVVVVVAVGAVSVVVGVWVVICSSDILIFQKIDLFEQNNEQNATFFLCLARHSDDNYHQNRQSMCAISSWRKREREEKTNKNVNKNI